MTCCPAWTAARQRQALAHLDTGQPLAEAAGKPVTANAYLAAGHHRGPRCGRGHRGLPRVTDASLVTALRPGGNGWRRESFDQLAGAVVAGHVIESARRPPGATTRSWTRSRPPLPRFPIAEVAADGSSVITKQPGYGRPGLPGTSRPSCSTDRRPAYANPDAVAHFERHASADGRTGLLISGTRASPPPATAKVAINFLGGYRNTMTLVLTGLTSRRRRVAEQELFAILGGRDQFADADARLLRFDRPYRPHERAATAHLRITVKDPTRARSARRFSNATMELPSAATRASTPRPADAGKRVRVYWPRSSRRRGAARGVLPTDHRATRPPTRVRPAWVVGGCAPSAARWQPRCRPATGRPRRRLNAWPAGTPTVTAPLGRSARPGPATRAATQRRI